MIVTLWRLRRYIPVVRWVAGVVRSATTRHVFLGVGSLVALFHILRTLWPGLLPWPPEHDSIAEGAVLAVLGPITSRLVSAVLQPELFESPGNLLKDVSPGGRA